MPEPAPDDIVGTLPDVTDLPWRDLIRPGSVTWHCLDRLERDRLLPATSAFANLMPPDADPGAPGEAF